MSEFPPDEFDEVGDDDRRRGSHRARVNPVLAVLPLLLVALAVVALVVGSITVLGGDSDQTAAPGGSGGAPTASNPAPSGTGPATTTRPAPAEPAAPRPSLPAPSSAEPSSPAPSSAEPSPTEPDRSGDVTVLNGTRTSGLAGDAAGVLEDAGWDDVGTGNYRGSSNPPTVVYYGDTSERATARLVAADLGDLPVAQDADIAAEEVTVVLGEDYG